MRVWQSFFLLSAVAAFSVAPSCNKDTPNPGNPVDADMAVMGDLAGVGADAGGDGFSGTDANPNADLLQPLSLVSATPSTGPTTGNVDITLTGTGFQSGVYVSIDGLSATVKSVSSSSLVVTLPARPGAKGFVPVVVRNPNNDSVTSSTVFAYFFGTLTFDPASKIAVGGSPNAIEAAELENNAKLDLVVTDNSTVGQMITLSGNGDGTFLAPGKYASGTNTFGLRVVDLDLDGFKDVLVTNSTSAPSGVGIHPNSKTGTFPTRQVVVSGDLPTSVDVGDANGDGILDLVVANSGGTSNNVTFHAGKTGGTFAAPVSLTASGIPRSVVFADLNKDGKLDIVVANEQSATVSVLMGDGKGAFATKVDYLAGSGPYAVVAMDFTGDGILDVIVVNYRSASLSLLTGVGDGTLNPQKTTSIGTALSTFPQSIVVADVNGDTRPDVVSALYADQQIGVTWNANGLFGTTTKLSAGSFPRSVTVGDFNGDGKNDLASANSSDGTVSILLNKSQ